LQDEERHCRIERLVGERQRVSGAYLERRTRVRRALPRERHIVFGRIQAHDTDSVARSKQRATQAPRAASSIENALSVPDSGKSHE
jgi:hypothetical protein